VVDGSFRDGIGILADVVFDVIFDFADLVGPDGASILEMDNIGRRRKRRE
jgi:hypothetical protein